MAVSIKCSFCNQPFEFDNTAGMLLATCPHCGKQNTKVDVRGQTQHLKLIHDAPALVGVKFCPKCKKRISADANVCIHCGYNLITRKRMKNAPAAAGRPPGRLLLGIVALLAIGYAGYRWLPPVQLAQPEPAEAVEPAPVAAPEPAPAPVDEKALFEAKRQEAAQAFRRKLDEDQPLYQPNDKVELRLGTGLVVHGSLLRYVGTDTNRVAVVATETGEQVIAVKDVDSATRRRMDANYRENYVRHRFKLPPASASEPAPGADPRMENEL